jgi:hypothetical protein
MRGAKCLNIASLAPVLPIAVHTGGLAGPIGDDAMRYDAVRRRSEGLSLASGLQRRLDNDAAMRCKDAKMQINWAACSEGCSTSLCCRNGGTGGA